jgi:AcrR family transcriptional regulator
MSPDPTTQRAKTRETRERSRARIVEATIELVRERSFAQLNVGEIMERAGIGRTLFYRHFDDLGDLLLRVAREAIDDLYDAQIALAETRVGPDPANVREAMELPVVVYERHGPVLRALAEAAATDPLVAEQQTALRDRFDVLVTEILERAGELLGNPPADTAESARALNRLVEGYLLEAFGGEPRVTAQVATETLSEIWLAFIARRSGYPFA